jgi:FkbM family methyltransferase
LGAAFPAVAPEAGKSSMWLIVKGRMSVLYQLNHANVFSRRVSLWGREFRSPSADRLLALWLFRMGLLGRWEAEVLGKLVRPGQTVADVGANQGIFTLLLSGLVGQSGSVLAFEPEPLLFRALSENCRRNGIRNIELFNSALSDRRGRATLHVSAVHSGDNRFDVAPGPGTAIEVDTLPLDDVLNGRRVDLVKIDVQGHEPKVFAGMDRTLRQNPAPVLVFEFWPDGLRQAGYDPNELLTSLGAIGYKLYVIKGAGSLEALEESDVSRLHGHLGFVDLVARAEQA